MYGISVSSWSQTSEDTIKKRERAVDDEKGKQSIEDAQYKGLVCRRIPAGKNETESRL